MIKRSFHTCSLWKGRKVNKKSREKDKQNPLSKIFVAHRIFVLCLSGDKACGTLISTLVTSVSSTGRSNREDQVQGHAERRRRMCTFLTIFLGFYLLHYLVCYNVKHHAIVVTLIITVRSLPSSSVTCWSFKVFVSCLLHCTHPPRASQNLQGGKKTVKLPTLQILLCAVVTHSLLSVKVCFGLAIFCVL